MISRIISVFLSIIMCLGTVFGSGAKLPEKQPETPTDYKYVFVHGLSGWGSYDLANKYVTYWGMFSGDLMYYLNKQGFDCYAASVAPVGSAWDRACELYAQLTGTVVDYGKEHSERCGHDRYGRDYGKDPLIEGWSAEEKINLLGHSFGGATVRMLTELMANGSEAEREYTQADDISPLFTGGKADWIYSVTTLAAPHNGTTAYSIDSKETTTTATSAKQYIEGLMTQVIPKATNDPFPDRADYDYAAFDMNIDNALELNERLSTVESIYYFSYPCSASDQNADGTWSPDESIMEALFVRSSDLMGAYTGVTEKGFVIDESWQENDGLVNTISARAPFGAPQKEYDGDVTTGVWNIMPTVRGDHMSLQGGMTKRNDVREFYTELLNMINSL